MMCRDGQAGAAAAVISSRRSSSTRASSAGQRAAEPRSRPGLCDASARAPARRDDAADRQLGWILGAESGQDTDQLQKARPPRSGARPWGRRRIDQPVADDCRRQSGWGKQARRMEHEAEGARARRQAREVRARTGGMVQLGCTSSPAISSAAGSTCAAPDGPGSTRRCAPAERRVVPLSAGSVAASDFVQPAGFRGRARRSDGRKAESASPADLVHDGTNGGTRVNSSAPTWRRSACPLGEHEIEVRPPSGRSRP